MGVLSYWYFRALKKAGLKIVQILMVSMLHGA